MKKIILISSLCTLISCGYSFSEKEVLGIYAVRDYQYSFDTIILKKDSVYERRMYDADKQLVIQMNGKWEFTSRTKSAIRFHSFFVNFDRDFKKYPELLTDTMDWLGYLYKINGEIQFSVGLYSASIPDQNCYYKIKE